jgi:hypothetical protein
MHVFNVAEDPLRPTFLLSAFSKDSNEGDAGPVRPRTEAHSDHHLRVWRGNAFIVDSHSEAFHARPLEVPQRQGML